MHIQYFINVYIYIHIVIHVQFFCIVLNNYVSTDNIDYMIVFILGVELQMSNDAKDANIKCELNERFLFLIFQNLIDSIISLINY